MDIPKPKDPRPSGYTAAEMAKEKKPFVRKPHLTQKPFQSSELAQLRNSLKKGGKR